MKLSEQSLDRFNNQHKCIKSYIDQLPPEAIYNRLNADKFSIHETIAYLTRYHHIFIDRLLQMKQEINPFFEIYRPEEDAEFAFTSAKTTGSLLHELYRLRSDLLLMMEDFPEEFSSRIGTHAVLGKMNIHQWIEFFLLHESAQLFKIFKLAGCFWSMGINNNDRIIYLPRLSNYIDEIAS